MPSNTLSRRDFLKRLIHVAGISLAGIHLPLPAWARGDGRAHADGTITDRFDLAIGQVPIRFGNTEAMATGINGSVPGPLLRMREGDRVKLKVSNFLAEDSSIHWHGLILPSNMDGVPGLSFTGIRPESHYNYEFDVRQNGTYWYHSHSGLQEQTGIYGPLVIEAAGTDPVACDREFVLLFSDWTFEDPERLLANLKRQDDYYNRQRLTLGELARDAGDDGLAAAIGDRTRWAGMRMNKADIADVTATTYTYLLNGQDAIGNWTGIFRPGERVRLRLINGSAMSFFNVRIPGLPMSVVQADGQNVEAVDVDELQIGVAETFDVIVTPGDRAYTVMAESMDRSGFVRGTLATAAGQVAEVPALRPTPRLTMADMGMRHHGAHGGSGHQHHHAPSAPVEHNHRRGPGVANLNENPRSRLDEPGIGLADAGHRVLRYSQLRSLDRNSDRRKSGRTLELHLTGNMHRYMWSFDGIKYSEVKGPIEFDYGERIRMVLVNDTMMAHPIHLHGMFVELVNGNGEFNPRKHTVVVKPAERLAVDLTADQPGLWAFHCHMLYHMKAGMMRAVRVSEPEASA